MAEAPCPTCKGAPPELNASVAKDGLIRLSQSFRDLLQAASDCEEAYRQAIELTDPVNQLEALKLCASKYGQAINISLIKDKMADVSKKAQEALLARARLQKEAEAQKIKDERQRALTTQQHEEHLLNIQNTKMVRVALAGVRDFIQNNPESPVIQKAKLMRAEFEARLEKEEADAEQKRYLYMGVGVFVAVGFLSWLASCIRFK